MRNIFYLFLLVTNLIYSQHTFDVNSQSVDINTNFSIEIGLDNSVEVTAFQFDLDYDGGAFDLLTGHTLTSRAENHSITASNINDNKIRVIVYSASNEVIDIGSGSILNLQCLSNNEPGSYSLSISEVILSDASGSGLSTSVINGNITIVGPEFNLQTASVNFGEIPIGSSPTQSVSISNDGNSDLVLSSHSLDAPFSTDQSFPLSISSGSSTSISINVATDSKQVVSKELTFTTNDVDPLRALQKTTIQADIFAVNEIYIGSGEGESNTEITIPVSVSNMEPFSGFQFDITLPNDVTFVENSSTYTSRASDHIIAANVISGNTLRFVAYSNSNATFSGNSGEVFNFKIIPNLNSGTYSLNISNPIISNVELGNITSDVYNGSFSIAAPYLSTNIQTIDYGRIPITEVQTTQIQLQNSGSAQLVIDELVYNTDILFFPLQLPLNIEVGASTSEDLVFTPNEIGLYDEDISVRNNSPDEQQIINVLADVFSPNYLRIVDKYVFREGTSSVSLNLVNNDLVRAIQFDIEFPDGFTLDLDNIAEATLLDDFTMSTSSIGTNEYRFVIYTLSNGTISVGDQTILSLPIYVAESVALGEYNFDITNVVLSSATNQNISSEALLTGIITVVEDTLPPAITVTGDNPMTIEVGSTFTDPGATVIDNYDDDVEITTNGTVDANTVGSYTITYIATDDSGNTSTATRVVNVVDTTSPTITCIETYSLNLDENGLGEISIDDILESSFDLSGIDNVSLSVNSFDCSSLGQNNITIAVTDYYGNSTECISTITVIDNTIPTVTAPDDITTCSIDNFELEDPEVQDNCSIVSITNDLPSTLEGDIVVTWTVTDSSGNISTTTQNIFMADLNPPTITAPEDIEISVTDGCVASNANLGSPVYSDDCAVAAVYNDAPDNLQLGQTTVIWTVEDEMGNIATAEQLVTVIDDIAPEITPSSADLNINCLASEVNIGTPNVSDNCSVASLTNDVPASDQFPVGITVVTWTAVDNSGNSSTYEQTINILDQISPEVICLDINLTLESGIAIITVEDIDGGSTDQCGIESIVLSQYEFTEEHIGENIVNMTVYDYAGNTSSCEALVTVEAGLSLTDNLFDNLLVYPNPSSVLIYLNTNFSLDYILYNSIGQKISDGKTDYEIDISELPSGVYYFRFLKDNQSTIRKVIKN